MADEIVKSGSHEWAIMGPEADGMSEALRLAIGGASISRFDLERVKVPSGGGTSWEIDDRSVEEFEGIIVGIQPQRTFYATPLEDSNEAGPPDCSSDDLETGHGNPGGPCIKCPNAVFGSAPRGEGQACKEYRHLMIVMHETFLPVVLQVPPTSIKACRAYLIKTSNRGGVRFFDAVTTFGLERQKGPPAYSTVTFKLARKLENTERAKIEKYRNMLMATLPDAGRDREPGEEDPT